jgi:hypothetical protein
MVIQNIPLQGTVWKKSEASDFPKLEDENQVPVASDMIPGVYVCPSLVHAPAITESISSKKPSPKILLLQDHQVGFDLRQTQAHGREDVLSELAESTHDPVDQLVFGLLLEIVLLVVPVHLNNGDIGLPESILAIAPAVAFFAHL